MIINLQQEFAKKSIADDILKSLAISGQDPDRFFIEVEVDPKSDFDNGVSDNVRVHILNKFTFEQGTMEFTQILRQDLL